MKKYLISYCLSDFDKYYTELFDAIKNNYPEYVHFQNVWLVKANDTPEEIHNKLQPMIYKNDSLFVIELADNYSGYMPADFWLWIKDNK